MPETLMGHLISALITVLEGRVAVLPSLWREQRAAPAQREDEAKRDATAPLLERGREAVPARAGTGRESEGPAPTFLAAGEQLTVGSRSTRTALQPRRANLAVTTAWTQRRLVIHDPSLNAFPISATFSTTDPASLIRFLKSQPRIEIDQIGSEVRISKRMKLCAFAVTTQQMQQRSIVIQTTFDQIGEAVRVSDVS